MKISTIVPVYNTEKQLKRCIDSILAQTYNNWELILVDDGSSDRSPLIIDEYTKKDARIKAIHQKNSGPGIARNTGIELANGDYIVFIDSDDEIKPNYYSELSKESADVVFIDIDQVDEEFKLLQEEHMSKYDSLSKDEFIRGQMTGKILWGGVRKAVKRQLLQNHNIRFTDHKIGEEAIYSFLIMHYAESFSFINGSLYQYVNRVGSQSDSGDADPWGNVALEMKGIITRMGLYSEYANTINAFIATAAIVSLDRIARSNSWKAYQREARKRIEKYRKDIDHNYPVDKKNMKWSALVLYPFLSVGICTPAFIASSIKRLIQNNRNSFK